MPTAILGRAFQRARETMHGAAKLEAALASLRELCVKYAEIERFYRDVAEVLSSYQARAESAQRAYEQAHTKRDLSAVKQALELWLPLRAVLDFAQHELGNLNTQKSANVALGKLVGEHPDAKRTLHKVCELKLSRARADAERVVQSEGRRLGSEYSPEDVADSPVVRRARSKVRDLEFLKNRIETERIESLWSLADSLLEDE